MIVLGSSSQAPPNQPTNQLLHARTRAFKLFGDEEHILMVLCTTFVVMWSFAFVQNQRLGISTAVSYIPENGGLEPICYISTSSCTPAAYAYLSGPKCSNHRTIS